MCLAHLVNNFLWNSQSSFEDIHIHSPNLPFREKEESLWYLILHQIVYRGLQEADTVFHKKKQQVVG